MKDDFALLADWTSQLGFLAEDLEILQEMQPAIFHGRIREGMLDELNETIELARKMKKKHKLEEYN